MEYEYALSQAIPVAAFLLDEEERAKVPRKYVDFGHLAQINEFRDICKKRMVRTWSDPKDLGNEVIASPGRIVLDRPGTG